MGTTMELGTCWDNISTERNACFRKGSQMANQGYQCERSQKNLEGVHEDLKKVCELAEEIRAERGLPQFTITDGCRSLEEQKELVAQGKSKTLKSRHLGGFAIDFYARSEGGVDYEFDTMRALAGCFKEAGEQLNMPVKWGGDWKHFKDTPHIELDREVYPDV